MKSYVSLRSVAMVLCHNGDSIHCQIRAEAEERAEHQTSSTIDSKVSYERLNNVD